MRDRKAHCVDGALFAAAAMSFHGAPPLIMELLAWRDDDHFLAVYKRDGFYGAVAKSNFVGLRSREPIYRTLRELALSYFESYYNMEKDKSLRGYSVTLDLRKWAFTHWTVEDERLEEIVDAVTALKHTQLMTPAQVAQLLPIDERTYQAGMLGANPDGIYYPDKEKKQ